MPYPGRYRVTVTAYPYQADTPVTLTLYQSARAVGPASLDDLIGSFDLVGDIPRTVEVTPFLRPGHLISPSVADLDRPSPGARLRGGATKGGGNVQTYPGEGIALKSMTFEGPLFDMWPPASTRQLLTGVEFDEDGEVQLTKDPYDHIVDIVARFAPLAFRRSLEEGELETFASLAEPLLADGRPFLEAVRVPLRAILSATPFLFQAGAPGTLDDYALASRLSYFLWRSLPDDELFDLARDHRLSDPTVLAAQVDRMLDDAKAQRFVTDFVGQAFRLYELKATAPDSGLYPEYDDRLGQAMAGETEQFLAEVIAEDLGVGHLIDADFTFVNRRLAEHYGMPGIEGQHMRKVMLAADSPRGGAADPGERAQDHGQRDDDLAGAARELRAGQPAGAAGVAATRGRRCHRAGHARDDDDSRAAGRASHQPGLRQLPPRDRPARVRAGVVRPDRAASGRTTESPVASPRRAAGPPDGIRKAPPLTRAA